MFSWLGLLRLVLTIADKLSEIVRDKQLLDAGEARAISHNLQEGMKRVEMAQKARGSVKHDPDSVRADPDNRD